MKRLSRVSQALLLVCSGLVVFSNPALAQSASTQTTSTQTALNSLGAQGTLSNTSNVTSQQATAATTTTTTGTSPNLAPAQWCVLSSSTPNPNPGVSGSILTSIQNAASGIASTVATTATLGTATVNAGEDVVSNAGDVVSGF